MPYRPCHSTCLSRARQPRLLHQTVICLHEQPTWTRRALLHACFPKLSPLSLLWLRSDDHVSFLVFSNPLYLAIPSFASLVCRWTLPRTCQIRPTRHCYYCQLPRQQLRRIELVLTSTAHSPSGSPVKVVSNACMEEGGRRDIRTGMPELVLMPAPVMTTTLRDFHNVLAISCRKASEPGSTWVVGILTRGPNFEGVVDRTRIKEPWLN